MVMSFGYADVFWLWWLCLLVLVMLALLFWSEPHYSFKVILLLAPFIIWWVCLPFGDANPLCYWVKVSPLCYWVRVSFSLIWWSAGPPLLLGDVFYWLWLSPIRWFFASSFIIGDVGPLYYWGFYYFILLPFGYLLRWPSLLLSKHCFLLVIVLTPFVIGCMLAPFIIWWEFLLEFLLPVGDCWPPFVIGWLIW